MLPIVGPLKPTPSSSPSPVNIESIPLRPPSPLSSSSSSMMFTWLRGDAHTPALVLRYLPVVDVAHLHASCTTWKEYISSTKMEYLSTTNAFITSPSRLEQAAQSSWLPHSASAMRLTYSNEIAQNQTAEKLYQYAAYHLHHHTSLLSAFTHLRHLEVHTVEEFLTAELFQAVGRLQHLKILRIQTVFGSWLDGTGKQQLVATLPLSSLRNCSLTTFCLQIGCGYHFTSQQVRDLVACESLTSINCAQWLRSEYSREDEPHEWAAENLALLSNMRSLRKINLTGASVSADGWKHLSQINTLTSLAPDTWSPSIHDQWLTLRNFTSLTELHYQPLKHSSGRPVCPQFWSALQQVPTITELKLRGVKITHDQLLGLFRNLRQLTRLRLLFVFLESCDAFSEAASLQELSLCRCTNWDKEVFLYHDRLPIIKYLRRLLIVENVLSDAWAGDEVPSEETISFFKSMLATRMPKLTTDRILYEIKE